MTKLLRVPILPGGLLNAFIIASGDSAIVVDAGLPDSEGKITALLTQCGLGLRSVRAIVLTHGHIDHIGAAAALKRATGAPIIAHAADLPFFRRQELPPFEPTGLFGRLFLGTGVMHREYTPIEPDIWLPTAGETSLAIFGVDARLRHTPGHTAGSLSVFWEQDAIVGDLVSSGILLGGLLLRDRPKPPPFEDDANSAKHHLRRFLDEGIQTFHMGHGGPLNAAAIARYTGYSRDA